MRGRAGAALVALLLFGWNVWGYDLWAPDEPYFGEGAREMVREGTWLVPRVLGEVTTDKPPLFFWVIAVLSLPFGRVTEVTARLPSILASIGTLALVLWLGRGGAGRRTGALAACVLATTYLFWDKARTAQIEALLCFLVLAAVSAFEAWRAGEMGGRRAGLLFWSASGLAVLAKGPVGVLLPLGIATVTLAWDRGLARWRSFAPVLGPALFAAVLLAWILPASVLVPDEYSVVEAFRRHVLERAVHGMHHLQPPWYYLTVLPVQLLPWSPLVPGALWLAWKRRGDARTRLLLVQAAFVVLFFSLWTEKRDLYVLPAYPALAILVARLVEEAGSTLGRRWASLPFGVLAGGMLVAGPAVFAAAGRLEEDLRQPTRLLGTAIAGSALLLAIAALRASPTTSARWVAGAFGVLYLLAVQFLYPAIDSWKSPREFAREVASRTASHRRAGGSVYGYRLGNVPRAIAFYTDGLYLRPVEDPEEMRAATRRAAEIWVVADPAELGSWPPELRSRAEAGLEHRLGRRSLTLVRLR